MIPCLRDHAFGHVTVYNVGMIRSPLFPDHTDIDVATLEGMDIEALEALVSQAAAALQRHRENNRRSLQSDMGKPARQAGLSPAEWQMLVGD